MTVLKGAVALLALCAFEVARSNKLSKATENRADYGVYGHNKQVVCYWGTWANYRPEPGKFTPENIDPDLCTNIIYSFAGLDSSTWEIKSLDTWMDLKENYGLAGFEKATNLKRNRPKLKVTLAIGGWNEGSPKYSTMAADPEKRASFIASAVIFLKKYNFDGLDLDWEYPGKRGGKPEDKENFIHLVKELKEAFTPENLLLTTAIGAAPDTIDVAYDVPNMYKYLDYVHIMCYDYHGKWDKRTGHNAPLFPRPDESIKDQSLNVEYTLKYLLDKGAIPSKTVLGVPLYGRAFTLMNANNNGMGAAAKTTSFQGPYTREDGFMGYNEICEEATNLEAPWEEVFDKDHQAPYMYRGDSWISYDDELSLKIKAEYAYDQGLAGVMTWSIDTDDFSGLCGGPRYPLLRTLNHALHLRERGILGTAAHAQSSYVPVLIALAAFLIR